MDPIDVLRCAVALAVFPGGLFLAAAAALVAVAGGLPGRRGPRLDEMAAIAAGVVAAALLPLPGTPLAGLASGIAMPGAAALLAAAVAWGGPRAWTRARMVAGIAAALAVLSLAAPATTLDLATVAGLPGRAVAAARILATIGLALAAPVLTGSRSTGAARASRAVVLAALLLLGVSLVISGDGATAGPAAAALGLAAVAAVSLVLRVARAQTALDDSVLAGAASVTALGAVVLAALG
jgi:hypothetical protein